jgi:hypothetical protein
MTKPLEIRSAASEGIFAFGLVQRASDRLRGNPSEHNGSGSTRKWAPCWFKESGENRKILPCGAYQAEVYQ